MVASSHNNGFKRNCLFEVLIIFEWKVNTTPVPGLFFRAKKSGKDHKKHIVIAMIVIASSSSILLLLINIQCIFYVRQQAVAAVGGGGHSWLQPPSETLQHWKDFNIRNTPTLERLQHYKDSAPPTVHNLSQQNFCSFKF